MPLINEVNQARLKLAPTAGSVQAGSVQYNLYQRGQAIRAGAPTAGETAAAAAREAESNSRAARDAAGVTPEEAEKIATEAEKIANEAIRIIEAVRNPYGEPT